MARQKTTIGKYLLDELYRRGIRDIFGIPGDYVLGFYEELEKHRIRRVGTTREDSAGFAADAYARVRGLGAVCVTYCVGGFNLVNPVAGAYAEKSPVVVISGAPGMKERESNPLLHHCVRDFSTQREIFEKITVASASLEDPLTAFHEIDRVLNAVEHYKRPGFIEIPRDMVDMAQVHRSALNGNVFPEDADALKECMTEVTEMLNNSKRPVILAGVEVHRFGMQDALVEFVEKSKFPVASTLLGKSVISEHHPLYLGVYEGAMGRSQVQRIVENSDCVLMLGCFMTDINLGVFTANLDSKRAISATTEKISIRRHHYEGISFEGFMRELLNLKIRRRRKPNVPADDHVWCNGVKDDSKISIRSLFGELNRFITEDMVVISDIGDCLFDAVDLKIHRRTEFLSPAYYASMGFGVPAALGAQTAAPQLRPVVLVGDGAFQMTGMELSTCVGHGLNPIVVVLNNHGYSTERQIMDGPFNDVNEWAFHRVPELLGSGWGFTVETVGDLRQALQASLANRDSFSILDVNLDAYDMSPALERLGERMGKNIKS